MKLYYSPGACSLSPHIVACEAGITLELETVDLAKKLTASGADFAVINPKGYVPALQLDDGKLLTEGPAIVQYLADLKPASGLLPPVGAFARYQVQEWLNYISTELHKQFSPLFNPGTVPAARDAALAAVNKRLDYVEQQLDGKDYLTGSIFTVADAYLFVVTGWGNFIKLDLLSARPRLKAFVGRVAGRPGVQAALKEEGLA